MENNPMNSVNNSVMSKVTSSDHEESGWTMYFDDFSNQQNHIENSSCFSSVLEGSLMSDVAFSAAKNNKVMGFSQEKRLSSKKRKTKVFVADDDLEDTASSPAHSPKVCNLMVEYLDKRLDKNNNMGISQTEKGSSSTQLEERSGVGCINGGDNERELKERGLCLVPLSVIVDYLA